MSIAGSSSAHFGPSPASAATHLDRAARDIRIFEEVPRSEYLGIGDTALQKQAVEHLHGNLLQAQRVLHVEPLPDRIKPTIRNFTVLKGAYASLESLLRKNAYRFDGLTTEESIQRALPKSESATSESGSGRSYYDVLSKPTSVAGTSDNPYSAVHTIDSAGNWRYKDDLSSS